MYINTKTCIVDCTRWQFLLVSCSWVSTMSHHVICDHALLILWITRYVANRDTSITQQLRQGKSSHASMNVIFISILFIPISRGYCHWTRSHHVFGCYPWSRARKIYRLDSKDFFMGRRHWYVSNVSMMWNQVHQPILFVFIEIAILSNYLNVGKLPYMLDYILG